MLTARSSQVVLLAVLMAKVWFPALTVRKGFSWTRMGNVWTVLRKLPTVKLVRSMKEDSLVWNVRTDLPREKTVKSV